MNISIHEFLGLQDEMSAKNIEIAQLRTWLAQLKRENDEWKAHSQQHSERANMIPGHCTFIVLSFQKLKKVLSSIHDVNLLGVINMVLQKCLTDDASADERKAIAEVIPLPQLSALTVHAEGDVHIDGDVNTENHFEPGSNSQVFNGNVNGNFEGE